MQVSGGDWREGRRVGGGRYGGRWKTDAGGRREGRRRAFLCPSGRRMQVVGRRAGGGRSGGRRMQVIGRRAGGGRSGGRRMQVIGGRARGGRSDGRWEEAMVIRVRARRRAEVIGGAGGGRSGGRWETDAGDRRSHDTWARGEGSPWSFACVGEQRWLEGGVEKDVLVGVGRRNHASDRRSDDTWATMEGRPWSFACVPVSEQRLAGGVGEGVLVGDGCRWLARGCRGGRSRPAWEAKRLAGEPTIVVCRTLAVPVPNHHRIYSQTFTFLITKTGNREAGGSSPPGGA